MSDARKLVQTLAATGATPLQVRMAATLLTVNGLANALAFVRNVTAPHDTCPVCGTDNGPLAQDGYGRYRHGLKCWACGCP
jgi:hypothetical protein